MDRRRSSRIVASKEKKHQEKERKLILSLERNKNSTKKRCNKSQLISLFKAMQEGRHAHNNESNSMNVSPQNNVPDKHVLEKIIDFLQRKDPHDLFGEPVNPDTVENYRIIVKEPMDFGTIRAKVHEGMYTSLEQFKRDVFLLCFNAMNAYPETSRYHKVAEDIGCHAVSVFEDLNAQHENLNLESSSNKERPRGNNIVRSKVSETEKRLMYWPPCNKSLISEFINAPKPNIQLSPINYKDSLLKFVKDCGPIAQKVAANKLEGLNISNVADKNIFINNNYQAVAAALMHKSVYDNAEKEVNLIGSEISDANENMSNNSILNRNMVSKVDNVFNMIRQKNFSASNQNMSISGNSSCSMPIIVHPTSVISKRPARENPFQS
ncbi:hypothetical protein P8452_25066 [Trifolium repens]|nr:hypothetical protein P8452_25066 [Trifolium repens]